MSGGSGYGAILLMLIGGALAAASLVMGGFWYWILPLWAAALATFGLAVLLCAIWLGLLVILNKQSVSSFFKSINIAIWVSGGVIAVVSGLFWLFADVPIWTALLFILSVFIYWNFWEFCRLSVFWIILYLGLASVCLLFFAPFFVYYAIFCCVLMLGLNWAVKNHLKTYLYLMNYPQIYYWFNKKITTADWALIFQKMDKTAKDEFFSFYLNQFVYVYLNDSSAHLQTYNSDDNPSLEIVFWQLLSNGEAELISQNETGQYSPLHVILNFSFIEKWQHHSQNNPNSDKLFTLFTTQSQAALANFIQLPEYYLAQLLKKENLEADIDAMLSKISDKHEELKIAYGLFYVAIGVARNFEPTS
jgi:hypothetical protein